MTTPSREEAERIATLLDGFDVMTNPARERAAANAAALIRSLLKQLEG